MNGRTTTPRIHPAEIAWQAYRESERGRRAIGTRWAALEQAAWAGFRAGWEAATVVARAALTGEEPEGER